MSALSESSCKVVKSFKTQSKSDSFLSTKKRKFMPPRCKCLRCEFQMKVNIFDVNFGWKSTLSNTLLHSTWDTKYKFHRLHAYIHRIARTFVWALGIIARCIRMAFVHFNGMSLAAFVNVWERTYTVKTEIEDLVIGQIRSEKNTQWSLLDSTYSFLSPKVFVKKSGTLFKRSLKKPLLILRVMSERGWMVRRCSQMCHEYFG